MRLCIAVLLLLQGTALAQQPFARISEADVRQLVTVGEEGSTFDFTGILKDGSGSTLVYINSSRAEISYRAAQAALKGGRYTPPASMRADIVQMTCGDEDFSDRWNCVRLAVVDFKGRRVAPLSYTSGPNVYRNALGASWRVVKSSASYRLADLVNGFTVRVAGDDSTEFAEEVSADRVAKELLATVPPTKAMRDAAERAEKEAAAAALAAEPEPPSFSLTVDATPRGWAVKSTDSAYTWTTCRLVMGPAFAVLPPIAPGSTNEVSSAALPGPPTDSATPLVRCFAKGRTFDGPVPTSFRVTAQRSSMDSWIVKNLTDWGWSTCEARFGSSVASVTYLSKDASAVFHASKFSPPVSATSDVRNLGFSCLANGQRVSATVEVR